MTLRLPPEIEDQLKQVAEVEHRSVQQTVLVAIEEYLSMRETAEILADPSALRGLAEARAVSPGPYELGMTRPARRAISELLAQDVAAAAVEFITGPLLEAPYRVGKPLRDTLSGFHSARLGTQWRVLYRIDESKYAVIVQDIQRRSSAYRRR
jgi:mRNA-degrading endonuclease RelE of RelBE toxin-antitoxin system/predicted transcriptional regulator